LIRIGKGFTSGLRLLVALAAIVAVPAFLAGPVATSANAGAFVSATNGSDAGNDCTDQYAPCATIQHAIDETVVNPFVSFPSINVAPGIYTEQLTVDKSLSLHGPNSRLDDRGPEAVIDGGGGTAITPEASNITISGFTISTDSAGTPIRTAGADVNRLTISDNLIEGGAAGVWLGAGGNETDLSSNVIKGDEYGIRLGAADFSELTIWYNRLTGPVDSNGVFAGSDTSIDGFRLEGSEFATANLAAGITNGWILANKIEPPAGRVGLLANLTDSYVRENSFRGEGAAACLQLLGGLGGLEPSNQILVDDHNEFAGCAPYALQLGPEVSAITITMNTFPNTYDGIVTDDSSPWDVTGSGITIWENRFVGLTHLGVYNAVGGELDAHDNWWGCNGGPGAVGCVNVSSGVDASPNVVLTAEAVEVEKDPWDAEPVHSLNPGEKAWIRTYLKDGDGGEALNVSIITDDPVLFSSSMGKLSWTSDTWFNAQSGTVFTAGPEPGPAEIIVMMDNQQVGVPLTICCESADSAPSPSMPSSASQPHIGIPGGALSLSRRNAVIGTISCAQSPCRIDQRSAVVKVGRTRFHARLKMQTDIAAESISQIRAIVPERAFRQLSRRGAGTLVVAIKVTDASGGTATLTRRIKIVPGDV
jgi:hypothetical protein